MFAIQKIDQLLSEDIEYLGTKRKFWFALNGERFLFKAEERGTGEDWAEKVVSELAALLGLPHVPYELAHEFQGEAPIQPGVICPTFAPRPLALVMGNQLLYVRDPAYPVASEKGYGFKDHTVDVVAAVVRLLSPPRSEWMRDAPLGITSALEVFIGYVMLDAWVANQDRHHQNWGAVLDGGVLYLAPTYDHGSSLARNLKDEERKNRLDTRDRNRNVEHFAAKARSGFFKTKQDRKTMFTLDVFRYFAQLEPRAAILWLEKLGSISSAAIDSILRNVPLQRMSPITRQFTLELLETNKRRLLEGYFS